MRILLTGTSGFAGAALLPRLLEQGHDVRALARDRTRVQAALAMRALAVSDNTGVASAGSAGSGDTGITSVASGTSAASGDTDVANRTSAGSGGAGGADMVGGCTSVADAVSLSDFELVIGDTLTGAGMPAAMRGVEVAYYLIHSMEPSPGELGFSARERASAETFAQAARAAGVQRIVYLGGPLPRVRADISPHLSSRYAVERVLLDAVPDSVALRASIVIGARSRSFRFLVRLIERLPVLALPAWRRFRTQPIDERDIVEMLAACASVDSVGGRSFDVGGPDVLTYGEVIERIADLMLLGRPSVGLGVTVTPIAARIAAVLASESPELVLPLMEGLTSDLLAKDSDAAELLNVEMHSFDSAVEHALYEWEKVERLAAR